ncbi:hypothetical protein [Agarivorans sp. 1_MG-2023]|uniref:hypothetical protein n=1 Tax=Agarivorans sp. 1_MG-2023 TaxID=3062634 RepID=UPI0026E3D5E4|nr:hypothetical protein [Agarivorans sp. 1_MG-2023]MDO6763757.1 hypothetical protein [Agarivorans sp. 1_MG-2023]
MNTLDKQLDILNQLSSIIHQSAAAGYESATCSFSIDGESVEEKFSFIKEGKKVSALLDDPSWLVMDLVIDLNKEMKESTGGEWKCFILTLDENGKAKTHFEYPK